MRGQTGCFASESGSVTLSAGQAGPEGHSGPLVGWLYPVTRRAGCSRVQIGLKNSLCVLDVVSPAGRGDACQRDTTTDRTGHTRNPELSDRRGTR
jgi:hypothetical protein